LTAAITLFLSDAKASALENGEFTAQLNGLKLWYKISGTGPVCIMPTAAWGPSSDYCFRTLKPMERYFTIVYLDSRGTGRSERPKSQADHTWNDLTADLDSLRAHLNQPKVWLMGHSEGGMQILQYACRYPNRVCGLVLIDTADAMGPEQDKDSAMRREWRKDQPWYSQADKALKANVNTDQELSDCLKQIMPFYWSAPGKAARFEDDFAATTFSIDAVHAEAVSKRLPFDLTGQLAKVKAPSLVIVGADDFICSLPAARKLHLDLPNSKLLVFEKCGHFPWMEQPEEFNAEVPRFLEALGLRMDQK
jgi:proline iminopeptidase